MLHKHTSDYDVLANTLRNLKLLGGCDRTKQASSDRVMMSNKHISKPRASGGNATAPLSAVMWDVGNACRNAKNSHFVWICLRIWNTTFNRLDFPSPDRPAFKTHRYRDTSNGSFLLRTGLLLLIMKRTELTLHYHTIPVTDSVFKFAWKKGSDRGSHHVYSVVSLVLHRYYIVIP